MQQLRIYIFIIFGLFQSSFIFAQKIKTTINSHIFVDNREYAHSGRYSQTIFGARFAPEIGIDMADTTHQFRVGVNLFHDMGQSKFLSQINPIIYYHYSKPKTQLYIGSFPRKDLISDYPRALLRDTLNYYRPLIEGLLAKFGDDQKSITTWIDWTSQQGQQKREQFLFGLKAQYKLQRFFGNMYFLMFHNSFSQQHGPQEFLQDNGGIYSQIGMNFNDWLAIDQAKISIGGMMGLYRTRGVTPFVFPKAFMSVLNLQYKKFYFENTLYLGQAQTSIWGDAFYSSKFYDRSDFTWQAIAYKGIEGKLTLSFHFIDGKIDSQQAFGIFYHFSK